MSFASQVRATTEPMHKISRLYTRNSWFVSLWQKVNQNLHGWKPTKISMVENQPKFPWLKTNQNFHGWKPTKISMVENQPKFPWLKVNQNAYGRKVAKQWLTIRMLMQRLFRTTWWLAYFAILLVCYLWHCKGTYSVPSLIWSRLLPNSYALFVSL